MATKKQKRLAGEARAVERDAAHSAEIKARARAAKNREERRMRREAAEERRARNIEATKALKRSFLPPKVERRDA